MSMKKLLDGQTLEVVTPSQGPRHHTEETSHSYALSEFLIVGSLITMKSLLWHQGGSVR